ncbi:MAG: ribbon-helix-helix protein, CopG family [Acidobacterium ailaaui]|nr:ribbon-helix-helix protein, CopG family [Pseudacidobacterium ailaaui]
MNRFRPKRGTVRHVTSSSFYLPSELVEALRRMAARHNTSASEIVRVILMSDLEVKEQLLAIEAEENEESQNNS